MGLITTLVCDGCLERIESEGVYFHSTDVDHRELFYTAARRKWTKRTVRIPRAQSFWQQTRTFEKRKQYFCAACTRILRAQTTAASSSGTD